MRTAFALISIATAGVFAATPAMAAAITNLSGVPQTVSFMEWGRERAVTIAPNETLRMFGNVTFLYQGREVRINENEEYAIWRDGTLGLQRTFKRRSLSGL